MVAVKKVAPLNPVPLRQAEAAQVVLAALTFPLRFTFHWAFASEPSRPMAALILPHQSRESRSRPVPGTTSPSSVPGRVTL